MFTLSLSPAIIALFSVLVASILALWALMPKLRLRMPKPVDDEKLPPASVIIYARDDDENLSTLLEQVLGQDYPAPMEVIVVNDGAPSDDVRELMARLQPVHPNLYLTFLPDRSRNLSRKKMAVTLGIKAANHDALLLTCGNCRVPSALWLRSMITPMARGKKVVIGYATPTAAHDRRLAPLAAFDYLWAAATFLRAARAHKPFRGTECNLAYSRDLFFRHKGFSTHLNLNYGDDDIFISSIATAKNAATVVCPDALVQSVLVNPRKAHRMWRLRYGFTSRFLHTTFPALMNMNSWLWIVNTGCAIALALVGLPSLIPLIVAAVLWVAVYVLLCLSWKVNGAVVGLNAGWFTPLMMIIRPLYNMKYWLLSRKTRADNYTWSQQG